jgi:hypothetical protein
MHHSSYENVDGTYYDLFPVVPTPAIAFPQPPKQAIFGVTIAPGTPPPTAQPQSNDQQILAKLLLTTSYPLPVVHKVKELLMSSTGTSRDIHTIIIKCCEIYKVSKFFQDLISRFCTTTFEPFVWGTEKMSQCVEKMSPHCTTCEKIVNYINRTDEGGPTDLEQMILLYHLCTAVPMTDSEKERKLFNKKLSTWVRQIRNLANIVERLCSSTHDGVCLLSLVKHSDLNKFHDVTQELTDDLVQTLRAVRRKTGESLYIETFNEPITNLLETMKTTAKCHHSNTKKDLEE